VRSSKKDAKTVSNGNNVPPGRIRKNAAGIMISSLGIVMVAGYLITELSEQNSLAGFLLHFSDPSLTFYHIMVLLSIPACMLIGYLYQKQQNLTKNLEQIVRERTARLRESEKKLKEYLEHLEEKVEERTRELKEAQKLLIKSERLAAIGEMATMVGHDLRNPLQAIENAVYVLSNELQHLPFHIANRKKLTEMLQVIGKSVGYANKIIKDLQDFSTTKKPIFKETNVNAVVEETLSQLEAPRNVKLVTELDNLPQIRADRGMIKRVFMNLATNGIQAMEENGGTLKVSTKKTREFVEVTFEDTGVGMSREEMRKLFTPFFTTKARGMGLGLPICKRFVELHSGYIEVESREGRGSTFTVKLPVRFRQR